MPPRPPAARPRTCCCPRSTTACNATIPRSERAPIVQSVIVIMTAPRKCFGDRRLFPLPCRSPNGLAHGRRGKERYTMAKQLMPKAELERRASDVTMTDEQFLKIGLFAQLKRKPSLDKFPGAMVLRRFRKGEVIFRQGEAGWTAFYTLTSEDLLAIEGKEEQPAPDLFKTLSP